MKIGIFGGTFNPPHKGHVSAIMEATKQLNLDKTFLMPVFTPPHKEMPQGSPDGQKRAEMLSIAVKDIDGVEVSDMEIKRGGQSYTCDTLAEFKKEFPEAELILLMGTDMYLSIEEWYHYRDILSLASLGVFSRCRDDKTEIRKFSEYLNEQYGVSSYIIENDAVDISSTELRDMLKARGGRDYLDENVYAYIIKHRLYEAQPDFQWLRERAYSMLDPKRIPHVKGCEEEAVRLAKRWGENEDDARTAGILHDITKKLNKDEQLLLCQKYGIIPDNIEKNETKLLHSKTGAAIAKYEFGVSDRVALAIEYHTTGRKNMTLLEKVLYLADYIEPNRKFDGLEELRKISYEDINGAMRLGLEMSMEDMAEHGIIPHPNSLRALEEL